MGCAIKDQYGTWAKEHARMCLPSLVPAADRQLMLGLFSARSPRATW